MEQGVFDTQLVRAGLRPDRGTPVQTPWGTMALYLVDGEVLCAQAFCPHLDGPLFQGSISDGVVTCPWHHWRYDLRSGRRVDFLRSPWVGGRRLARCRVFEGASGTLLLEWLDSRAEPPLA